MSRFYNGERHAAYAKQMAHQDFADLLFAKLHRFGEGAPEKIAAHLDIEVSDVYEWLEMKSLPCRSLVSRLTVLLRGSGFFNQVDQEAEWGRINDFIQEVENVQTLMNTKLTQSRTHGGLITEND